MTVWACQVIPQIHRNFPINYLPIHPPNYICIYLSSIHLLIHSSTHLCIHLLTEPYINPFILASIHPSHHINSLIHQSSTHKYLLHAEHCRGRHQLNRHGSWILWFQRLMKWAKMASTLFLVLFFLRKMQKSWLTMIPLQIFHFRMGWKHTTHQFCSLHSVQNWINYMSYSMHYYKMGFVLDNLAYLQATVSVLSTFQGGQAKLCCLVYQV